LKNWRRRPRLPRAIWMKTIQWDMKSNHHRLSVCKKMQFTSVKICRYLNTRLNRNYGVCLHLFCQAPLGVRSAKGRHQSPEWTILSHVNCFVQGEVIGFQVLLDSLHPHSTRASWWSPPVCMDGSKNVVCCTMNLPVHSLMCIYLYSVFTCTMYLPILILMCSVRCRDSM